jgi:hypothetical protein
MARWNKETLEKFEQLLKELYDPVKQAENAIKLSPYNPDRTDPWRWYCRSCSAEGTADFELDRDRDALAHVDTCPNGRFMHVQSESIERLRHVWSWGEPTMTGFPTLVKRLYLEIATLAGVEDPQARVKEVLEEFNGLKVTEEHTNRLLKRLKEP